MGPELDWVAHDMYQTTGLQGLRTYYSSCQTCHYLPHLPYLLPCLLPHSQVQLQRGVEQGGERAMRLFKHTLAYKAAMGARRMCGRLCITCKEEHTIMSMLAPPQDEEALTPAQTIQVRAV